MQNYSAIQKFLHDFVFSKKIINRSLFELEKIIYLKNKDNVQSIPANRMDCKSITYFYNRTVKVWNYQFIKLLIFIRRVCIFNL